MTCNWYEISPQTKVIRGTCYFTYNVLLHITSNVPFKDVPCKDAAF